jgi:hypothetical protein
MHENGIAELDGRADMSRRRSAGALYRDYRVAQWCGAGDARVRDFDMRSPCARQVPELARAMTSGGCQQYLAVTARAQARVKGVPIEVEPATKFRWMINRAARS